MTNQLASTLTHRCAIDSSGWPIPPAPHTHEQVAEYVRDDIARQAAAFRAAVAKAEGKR